MEACASTTELDRLGDEIAELSAHLEAATARLLDLIASSTPAAAGTSEFSSCAAWLSWRVGFAPGAAGSTSGGARARYAAPAVARTRPRRTVLRQGQGVDARATPETEERCWRGPRRHRRARRANRAGLAPDGRKAEAREADRQLPAVPLHVYPDEDGTVRIRGRLTPEVGALLMKALAAAPRSVPPAGRPGAGGESPTLSSSRRCPAVLARARSPGIEPGAPGERYQVVVTWMPPSWPTRPGRPVRPRDGLRVPPERRSAWPATRAGS